MKNQTKKSTLFPTCGDSLTIYKMEQFNQSVGKFTDGHNLYLSTDKKSLEVKEYINAQNERLICSKSIENQFVGITIEKKNNLHYLSFVEPSEHDNKVEVNSINFEIRVSREYKFIGSDDIRQGFVFETIFELGGQYDREVYIKYDSPSAKVMISFDRTDIQKIKKEQKNNMLDKTQGKKKTI